jgi:hypothetical protein
LYLLTSSIIKYHYDNKKYTGPYAVGELISNSQGRKVVVYPIISSSEKYGWKIKSASSLGNNNSAGMDCQRSAKLSSLWKIIRGEDDNIQTHKTKAASTIDLNKDKEKSKRLAELHRMVQGISSSDY